ncbi:MAG TPA: glycoside hydrolase family 16 protein [Acidobacteriaceae bacterium]
MRPIYLLFAAVLLAGCGVQPPAGNSAATTPAPVLNQAIVTVLPAGLPAAYPTFTEDFNQGYLDQTKWSNSYVNTSTFDTDRPLWTSDAFDFLPGGGIRLRADNRPTTVPANHPGLNKLYTAGAITTYGSFSQAYGYFEVKARLPKGSGMFPAFWFLAQNVGIYPPEIDVFEGQGADPTYQDENWFWKNPTTGATADAPNAYSGGPDWTAAYHTYGLAWMPGQLIFYIDGLAHYTQNSANVTAEPMYIILDADIGIFNHGTIVGTSQFPGYLDVLYVHAYQFQGMPAGNTIPFTWGKTTLSALTVSPGDTVTLHSTLVNGPTSGTGNDGTTGPHVNFLVKDYFYDANSTVYSNTAITVPTPMDAGATLPVTASFKVPTTMPAGIYNYSMSACYSVGCSSRSQLNPGGAPARFTVVSQPLLTLSSLGLTPPQGKPYSGSVTYLDSGKTIQMQGNMWLTAPYSYTVTPSTMLEFDFSSTAAGDDYCVGLFPSANYGALPAQQFLFQIGGGRQLGVQSFNHYVTSSGSIHYMIPVGDYYNGSMVNLVLLSTNGTTANANATFSNIRIYEGP